MTLTRRGFLAGTAGLAGALGGGLLTGHAAASGAEGCRLVVVTALGGWDVSYALDPKPASELVDGPELDEDGDVPDDVEAITTFEDIDIATNAVKRPAVTSFFERWASRAVVVRGLWIGSVAHDECRIRLLTGAEQETRPDLAAIAGAQLGTGAPIPYMDLGGAGFTGELAAFSGRTGRRNQLRHLLDRRLPLRGPTGTTLRHPLYRPHPEDAGRVEDWLQRRAASWAATRGLGRGAPRLDDWFVARDRMRAVLRDGAGFAEALGTAGFGLTGQSDLAVELLRSGLARTVLVDSGLDWDTHDDAAAQHLLHDQLFAGLDHLLDTLDAEDLLDTTVVAVLSEMTRTPRRNDAGGKDHWPVTSALLLGGPLRGGRVLGATDGALDAAPVDLRTGLPDPRGVSLRYDHFAAGLLTALDVDPEPWFPGVEALRGLVA